jgi:ABC-type branched-subunit amino acid transport system substrate-binding protein
MNNKEEYYHVGGNLKPDDHSYIERQADKNLYEKIKSGKFCYVFNSRQTGKSSLQIRVRRKLETEGFKCVTLDLSGFGTKEVNQEQWYYTFIKRIADSCNIQREKLSDFWQDSKQLTFLQRLNSFFTEILLVEVAEEIIIFIDEIDAVLALGFSSGDFFTFIRYCYNQRANNPEYNRITFALLGVATPSQLIPNSQITPFNIGEAIELNGFSFNEARPLAKGLETKVNNPQIAEKILQEVLNWTGGQPFLTQKICKIIAEDETEITFRENEIVKWVEDLVKSRIINDWEFQDKPQHLKTIRQRIINSSDTFKLLELYLKILQEQEIKVDDSQAQSELILSGLVVKNNQKLKIYNCIYECVFDPNWVAEMLADKRPYEEEFLAWKANQNKSWLLRGKKLRKSMAWTVGKNLTIEDYQFLNASQELEIRLSQNRQRLTSILSVILALGTGVAGFQLIDKIRSIFIPYIANAELFSQGEKSFLNRDSDFYIVAGVKAFQAGDYATAVKFLKIGRNTDINNPEAEIYYNNALAHQRQKEKNTQLLTVAIVVPLYNSFELSREMLRGVAQAQNEFNEKHKLSGQLLNIVIANDNNDENLAPQVAQELIKDQNVLGVIGHYTSSNSIKALPEYEKAGIAMISPGSTSNRLQGKVFFRTIIRNQEAANLLSEYAINKQIKKVVIYYKPNDAYSDDLKQSFEKSFTSEKDGREVIRTVDLSNPNLETSAQLITNIAVDKANAAVFFPSTDVVSTVFEIVRYKNNSSKNFYLLAGSSLYKPETLNQAKNSLNGLVLVTPWFSDDKKAQNFANEACKRWGGGVSWRTAASYDATQALIKTISESPNPSRETVLKKLTSIQLSEQETSGYPLKFNNGEREGIKPILLRVAPGSGKSKSSNNYCKTSEAYGSHFEKVQENQLPSK